MEHNTADKIWVIKPTPYSWKRPYIVKYLPQSLVQPLKHLYEDGLGVIPNFGAGELCQRKSPKLQLGGLGHQGFVVANPVHVHVPSAREDVVLVVLACCKGLGDALTEFGQVLCWKDCKVWFVFARRFKILAEK